MNQPQIELSEETLRRFVLGLLDEFEAMQVSELLEKNPAAAARAAAIPPDSFLDKMVDAARDTRALTTESTSVDRISSATSRPTTAQPPPNHRPTTAKEPMNQPSAESTIPNLHPELAALQQYRFIKPLGAGGMGLVYLAENLHMGRREEALKILNDSQMRQRGSRERFDQEISVAAQLHHPNIVISYNSIRLSSITVFVMQYAKGQDLDEYVRSKGAMCIADACDVIRQAAAGLQYAMEMKTIHRDIKPGNLVRTEVGAENVVKILDFGLAKAQMETGSNAGLTSTGTGMGTPHYMAPEQFRSAATVDIRADIYSLGCTLYFLLTGKPPFSGTVYEVYDAIQSQQAISLSAVRADVPDALAAVVAKMMAKEPSKRYQRPDEIAAALTPFLGLKGPAPANIASDNAGFATTVSVPPVRQDTQIEPEPQSTPPVENTPPADHVAQLESFAQLAPVARQTTASLKVQPIVQTASLFKEPISWRKFVGAGLVACALLGFIAAAVILSIRTQNGTIVFQKLPEDAEVTVDGETVTVKWDGNRESATVAVKAGSHNVEVRRDGIKVEGTTVTVSSGETTRLVVRAEPPKRPLSEPKSPAMTPTVPPIVPTPSQRPVLANTYTSPFTGMEFVLVSKATFTMGSPEGEPERQTDEAQHQVTLSQDFFLGKYEVTQEEFEKLMDFNPSNLKGSRLPVETVSWYDAVWFCNQMSDRDGRTPYYSITGVVKKEQSISEANVTIQRGANGYRLPTEAEWEYACRAGEKTSTPFSFGANITPEQVNYNGNLPYNNTDKGIYREKTVEVDAFSGNRFGLYQMHGNVWEWCYDYYGNYPSGNVTDPIGPTTGSYRVFRGGGWYDLARYCRSADRSDYTPDYRRLSVGFRVAVGR